MDNSFDSLYFEGRELIAGLDESGVSDIAGPLIAACVILPKINFDADDLRIFNVTDSKDIHEKYRKHHASIVWEQALAIGIGEVSAGRLDIIGKRRGIIEAMMKALLACQNKNKKIILPELLLIDGEFSLPVTIPQESIKDGDTKSLSIAAASVIAKVYRDEIMMQFHQSFPYYAWNKNKGHPCEPHFKGIDHHGIQEGIHRVKGWPFIPNKKEDTNEWYQRRSYWGQKTHEEFFAEKENCPWIIKPQSSKHLKKCNKLQIQKTNETLGNG